MIVVQKSTTGITIDGHAGYAEKGKDIICAAVSILTWNLVKSIKVLTEDFIEYESASGHIDIKFKNLSEHGKFLVDSFFVGINEIIVVYGDEYVKFFQHEL